MHRLGVDIAGGEGALVDEAWLRHLGGTSAIYWDGEARVGGKPWAAVGRLSGKSLELSGTIRPRHTFGCSQRVSGVQSQHMGEIAMAWWVKGPPQGKIQETPALKDQTKNTDPAEETTK